MRILLLGIAVTCAVICGCSFRDFLSYREDTGLYVIDRPDGFNNARFGTEIAATSTAERDLISVSAGPGHAAAVFLVAENGRLEDVNAPSDMLKITGGEGTSDITAGTAGATLVGLPTWGRGLHGCLAIGEPGKPAVSIKCGDQNSMGEAVHVISQTGAAGFGRLLAGVRPVGAEPWLLAVASAQDVWVYSDHESPEENRTDVFSPGTGETITALAAGRYDGHIMVAVADASGVYLFVQQYPNAKQMILALCLESPNTATTGINATLADLNGDNVDELLLAYAGPDPAQTEAVYVYDVADLIPLHALPPDPPTECVSPAPLATLASATNPDIPAMSGFGTAVVVGDIATDDSGPEIIVGAPLDRVSGKKEAGSVLIFRGAEVFNGEIAVAGRVTDSTPSGGHRFGGGLAVAPMAGRNELVVGAVGKGQVFIAYCTGVGTDLTQGADTTTNGQGKVISTRCRLQKQSKAERP
ncbi:MAG: hypothetical protein QNJ97_01445 [Myxococcota bacterium]|nr:hypothetical protein [Myxococcota bacterium]